MVVKFIKILLIRITNIVIYRHWSIIWMFLDIGRYYYILIIIDIIFKWNNNESQLTIYNLYIGKYYIIRSIFVAWLFLIKYYLINYVSNVPQ